MLLKTLATIAILAICVDGMPPEHVHEPKHAVSSQSFHRDDVPLSYKYSAIHVYTTSRPEQRSHNQQDTLAHNIIQYAPIQPTREHQHEITEQRNEYVTERTLKNLEPRLVAENMDQDSQNYRFYVPGHNIEVLQSDRVQGKDDLYRASHNQRDLQNQKVNIPSFLVYRKPEQQEQITPQNIEPLPEKYHILYSFLPKQYGANSQYKNHEVEKLQSIHQAFNPKVARLHLNLARVYNIAHTPQQANLQRVSRIGKPPIYTEAIFLPLQNQHKTILYPVQDRNKNYPILP